MTSLQLQLQRDYVLSRQEQLRVYLSNQCRPDGREFEALKPIVLSSDVHSASSFGSSLVKWGNTLVSCSVTVQVGTPDPQAPSEGSIVFDAALWSICSSSYDSQRHKKPSDALLIESTLSKLYSGSEAIDLTQLCIEAVVCLSSDGSVLEAAILAVSAALARTVLPAVSLDENLKIRLTSPSQSRAELAKASSVQGGHNSSGTEYSSDTSNACSRVRALNVKRHFAGLSLVVAVGGEGSTVLLFDPSLQETETESETEEEGLSLSRVLVVVNLEGDLCLVRGSSGSALPSDQFLQICDACSRKAHAQVIPLLLPLLT